MTDGIDRALAAARKAESEKRNRALYERIALRREGGLRLLASARGLNVEERRRSAENFSRKFAPSR